jgi:hypothetical protein
LQVKIIIVIRIMVVIILMKRKLAIKQVLLGCTAIKRREEGSASTILFKAQGTPQGLFILKSESPKVSINVIGTG